MFLNKGSARAAEDPEGYPRRGCDDWNCLLPSPPKICNLSTCRYAYANEA